MVRNWVIAGLTAASFAGPAASGAEQQRVTWPEAIEYAMQHGSACSFFGPVAKNLGLSDGAIIKSSQSSAIRSEIFTSPTRQSFFR